MKAEIISIGTELLLGEITDTNASFLAGELPGLGVNLYWISQVGDNKPRLVEALERAWGRADLILTTGGLGPTEDDVTREAVATFLGETPQPVPELETELRELFVRLGREMPLANLKQAVIIPSAEAVPNQSGTAPGWWVEKDGHILVAMPGPPPEMQLMWHKQVLPRLRQQTGSSILISRTLKTFGLTEAHVAERIAPFLSASNPTLGIYAKSDGVQLRLAAKAPRREQAEAMIKQGEAELREVLGGHIWGTDSDTLESVASRLLTEKGLSLAVAESYTGGLLTSVLTVSPGAASWFQGGLVIPTEEARLMAGLDPELKPESAEAALAMAEAARARLGAAVGLGISGEDESGEIADRLFGSFHVGLVYGNDSRVVSSHYPGVRTRVRRWVVSLALYELRKLLKGNS